MCAQFMRVAPNERQAPRAVPRNDNALAMSGDAHWRETFAHILIREADPDAGAVSDLSSASAH